VGPQLHVPTGNAQFGSQAGPNGLSEQKLAVASFKVKQIAAGSPRLSFFKVTE